MPREDFELAVFAGILELAGFSFSPGSAPIPMAEVRRANRKILDHWALVSAGREADIEPMLVVEQILECEDTDGDER